MASKIYLFPAANGTLFAARRVDPGEGFGPEYERPVREPGVLFYRVQRGELLWGEEISPGHLKGTRLTSEPLPWSEFMAHRGSLDFPSHAPSAIDRASVEAAQAFLARAPHAVAAP